MLAANRAVAHHQNYLYVVDLWIRSCHHVMNDELLLIIYPQKKKVLFIGFGLKPTFLPLMGHIIFGLKPKFSVCILYILK